jgi:hypothetical protein
MLITVLLRRYVLSVEVGSGVRGWARVPGVGQSNLLHEAESDTRAGRVGALDIETTGRSGRGLE